MKRSAILILLVVGACKSESAKLADELDRSSSWLATLAAVRKTTVANRTPTRFSRDAIRDASDELSKAAGKIAGASPSDIATQGVRLIQAARTRMTDTTWLEAAADTLKDLSDRARQQKP
jgi:hypothetical protein